LFIVLNLVVLALAIWIAIQGGDWLKTHPYLAKYELRIRSLAIAALIGIPASTLLRNTRHARISGDSVRISPKQFPELYDILVRHCDRIGFQPLPELYVTDHASKEPARAFSSWKCNYIVLGSTFLQPDLKPMLGVFSFLIGRELGRLRLGHTSWWNELLLSYVMKIPYVKNPMIHMYLYSEDRYGAYLASDSLPGLIGIAVGRRMLPVTDLSQYLSDDAYGSFWDDLATFVSDTPPIYRRLRALHDAGLLDVK
jgi:hypothetical protein